MTIVEQFKAAATPNFKITLDPEEAALVGAFTEDALSEQEAEEATIDLPEALHD